MRKPEDYGVNRESVRDTYATIHAILNDDEIAARVIFANADQFELAVGLASVAIAFSKAANVDIGEYITHAVGRLNATEGAA